MTLAKPFKGGLLLLLAGMPLRQFGADLTPLTAGRHVHVVMLGHGLLCDGKVQLRTPDQVTVRLRTTTAACGQRGELLRISKEQATEIAPEKRLTKGRIAARLLLGAAGIAALTAIPLTGSDPENWLFLVNGVLPGFIACGAWRVVPERTDYVVLMACPDSLHCFSK
jgi:hypothetical protein